MDIVNKLNENDLEYVTSYLIEELTVFLNGFKYKEIHFNLLPYPGLRLFDITYKLKNKQIFPKLVDKLYIDTKTAYLEAYA